MQCLPRDFLSDGKIDCVDGSDEPYHKTTHMQNTCILQTFSTGLLKESVYLPNNNICFKKSCPPNFFMCNQRHYCISVELICDGIHHCLLGDDETHCG